VCDYLFPISFALTDRGCSVVSMVYSLYRNISHSSIRMLSIKDDHQKYYLSYEYGLPLIKRKVKVKG